MLIVFFKPLQLQFAATAHGSSFLISSSQYLCIHGMLKFRVYYSLHQLFSNFFAGSQCFEIHLYNGVSLALEDFADAVLHFCVVDAEEGDGGAQQVRCSLRGREPTSFATLSTFSTILCGSLLISAIDCLSSAG